MTAEALSAATRPGSRTDDPGVGVDEPESGGLRSGGPGSGGPEDRSPARREVAGLRLVRALPVPQCEPHPATSTASAPPPAVHPAQCALVLVPEPRARRGTGGWPGRGRRPIDLDDDRPRRTPTAQLPDPAALVTALVPAALEVIAGSRPATQLVRLLSTDAYADLQRRAARAARSRSRPTAVRRATVRRVVATVPRDGVVEASVVVQQAQRVRAVAVRLEGWDGRWRVTALEVG